MSLGKKEKIHIHSYAIGQFPQMQGRYLVCPSFRGRKSPLKVNQNKQKVTFIDIQKARNKIKQEIKKQPSDSHKNLLFSIMEKARKQLPQISKQSPKVSRSKEKTQMIREFDWKHSKKIKIARCNKVRGSFNESIQKNKQKIQQIILENRNRQKELQFLKYHVYQNVVKPYYSPKIRNQVRYRYHSQNPQRICNHRSVQIFPEQKNHSKKYSQANINKSTENYNNQLSKRSLAKQFKQIDDNEIYTNLQRYEEEQSFNNIKQDTKISRWN